MQTDLPAVPLTRDGPTGAQQASGIVSGSVAIDPLALTWIRPALEEIWTQVRSTLESFVQDPGAQDILRPVSDQLKHLVGLFDLIGMPGPRLILLEAVRLIDALLRQGKVDVGVVEPLLVAVSRTALFVDLLRRGKDVPDLSLLPAINGLREIQGLPALGVRDFIERMALMRAELPQRVRLSPEAARRAASEAHSLLERALLAWLKGQPQAHLAVARAFAQAKDVAVTREEGVLWWSAALLARTMNDPRMAQAAGLKPLLGRLNRKLKQRGENGFEPSPQAVIGDLELTHEVLSLLVQHVSQHPALLQGLADLAWPFQVAGALEREAAENALLVAEPEILAQAAEQLKAALDPLQDRFDLAMRSGDIQAIPGMAPDLEQLAATMRMLELDEGAAELESEAARLRDIQSRGGALDEPALERVACTLMRADFEIERMRLGLSPVEHEGNGGAMLVEARDHVARQGLEDLLLAKEWLLTMWKDTRGEDRYGEVRQLLERVRGGFEMLSMPSWSVLVGGILDYVAKLPHGVVPPVHEQESVADAFASLEYGLENLRDYRHAPESVLVYGEQALHRLGVAGQSTGVASAPAFVETSGAVEPEIVESIPPLEVPPVAVLEKVSVPESLPPGEVETQVAEAPFTAEPELPETVLAMFGAGAPAVLGVPRLVPEETDSEILEIFVEEAREVLDTIHHQLQKWMAAPADKTAQTELRRAFHTLKGSGRIIGAQLVGEFGWAFENLLNRVLEGVLTPSESLFQLLELALPKLEQLLDALEGKPGLVVEEVEALCAAATAFLTDGDVALARLTATMAPAEENDVTADGGVADVTPPVAEVAEVEVPVSPVPRIDPQLYEIFRSEIEGYLQTLRQAAERGLREGGLHPDAELIRVTHSLLGSARTAGASRIVGIAGHLEHAMRLASETQQTFDAPLLNLTQEVVDTINLLLDDIGGYEVQLPDLDRLVDLLGEEVERLQAQAARGSIEAVETGEAVEAVEGYDIPAEQDPMLLDIFREEAEEILQQLDEALASWQRDPTSKQLQQALQRHLHTFKGGARMAGMYRMGALAHHLENVFMDLEANRYPANPGLLTFMQGVFDHLHGMVERLRSGQPIAPATDLIDALENLRQSGGVPLGAPAPMGTKAQPDVVGHVPAADLPAEIMVALDEIHASTPVGHPSVEVEPAAAIETPVGARPAVPDQGEAPAAAPVMGEVLRVRAELLDRMVTSAGEAAIYQARLSQHFAGFSRQLHELEQTVVRLRAQLRRMEIENEAQMVWRFQQETGRTADEFDPLEFDRFTLQQELSRGVMESLGDIESVQEALEDSLRDAEMLLTQQGRLGQILQDGLLGARLVRFADVVPRLKRLVRQVARDLGKQAELEVQGAEVELDRGLLNTLVPAFEHMLRNSLAHGIESPEERAARGKSRQGSIHLRIASRGGLILITLEDDGAGIDVEAVRRKARENGILDERAAKDDQAAYQLIFHSGLSTAREVSMVAGRGVGMDVVTEALRQVGGDIQVDSRRGVGVSFRMHLPLTQSITQGIAVTVGEQSFALPYSGIEAILRAPASRLATLMAEESPTWEHAGQQLPLVDLGRLLGLSAERRGGVVTEGMVPLLLLRLGERRLVLRIDALHGSQQLFIKALGPFLTKVSALAGATLLGDGRVVLVLDVADLFRLASQATTTPAEAAIPQSMRAQVLVVDDSITIRKVTTRILERYGIEVATAKDGVDALAWLHDHRPSVVLSDIEMPRMDGFELLASIRNEARLKDLPVIMITSRTGQKHREKAESLGVNAYLGKPYTEADLISALRAWLPAEFDQAVRVEGRMA